MKTIRIECVRKIAHDDTLYGTGLWTPGEKRDVPVERAPYLLWHADVWADARPAAARKKEPVLPMKRPTAYHPDEALPAVNLSTMSKESLARYASMNFGDRLDPAKMTRAQLNAHVIGRIRERA